jgi:very-short-patch-repair endonuclease
VRQPLVGPVQQRKRHNRGRVILCTVRPNRAEPFIGTEALASGLFNRHQLRMRHQLVFPNVYLSKQTPLSLDRRTAAAWLWSGRKATIAGLAAAALHGSNWIDDDITIELIHCNTRPPRGVLTRRDVLLDGEVSAVGAMAVTTPERTAFDIGRRQPLRAAVARLDALARATGLQVDGVISIADRHPGAYGLRKLETSLELLDAGAQSPRETYLRLLLIHAGLPRPRTQIPVITDEQTYYLDMGWEDYMVAVEYEGDHHRTDPLQYRKDIKRLEALERIGWIVIRVVAGDHPAAILRRVRVAIDSRKSTVY